MALKAGNKSQSIMEYQDIRLLSLLCVTNSHLNVRAYNYGRRILIGKATSD